ncbi:hypothetical protein [Tumebacillus permanentifrigoris]|uniref:HTH cro/C1-type domain-containing protein n=1 Tax=Tumebacillus permanentifrigoris TaxID=378543 RepID=A0A316DFT1_9BACL|nr:hypothetical protein [Tumebacillus permanentifrigoris]PWK16468.1 hypothetical protein C7459_101332 [Tumebacillus permanentifrigoris]
MITVDQKTRSQIPLGRRISEIMQEKGDAFTIRAFAQRLGMNRESMRKSLAGERPFSSEELEPIINGLGITQDRLKQIDTYEKERDLISTLEGKTRNKVTMERATRLANELAEVAIGATERGYSLNNLGRVQFLQRDYDGSHESWLKAMTYAKKVHEEYQDNRLLDFVTANLMLTYISQKEYSNIEEVLNTVEKAFPENPRVLGNVYYARMRVQADRGNLEIARKYGYRSQEHYEQTNDSNAIGKSLVNLVYIEYLNGEYKISARASMTAIKHLQENDDILAVAIMYCVKSLLKLEKYETALTLLEQHASLLEEYPTISSKVQIIYTILKNDPLYAIRVSEDSSQTLKIRAFACKCLFEFYAKRDDSESAMRYYKQERIYSRSKREFFDEEDF